jgi:malate dehydrogenase (oxaloacetate-decarboxylating)
VAAAAAGGVEPATTVSSRLTPPAEVCDSEHSLRAIPAVLHREGSPTASHAKGPAMSAGSSSARPDPSDPVFALHAGGKLELALRSPLRSSRDLSLAYTPGVAEVSRAIAADPSLVDVYTGRARTVAVVTDGTAVLGLGDVGPRAALPVMEGKAMLFKHFAGLDAVPLCLDTTDVGQIVDMVAALAPTFGGINLEDISAPRCFEIERRLVERLDLPVFHDDQHGTAIVTLAALTNGAKVVGKEPVGLRVVVSGAGAAGVAIANMLRRAGVVDVVVCDSRGIVGPHRDDLADHKRRLAATTNPRRLQGGIAAAMAGADVLVGVSGGTVPEEAVASMASGAMVFAMANPHPEVHPEVAMRHATVVATGRSDFPNQINNVLAFPGVFRGALDARATQITEAMKLAAAEAIAGCVPEPTADAIVPSVFDETVVPAVAAAVAAAARRDGVCRS